MVFDITAIALEQYNKFIGKEQAAGELGRFTQREGVRS